jgi:hypothetical protein
MFCSNCGVENPANATSCIQCGQPLRSIAAAADSPPPPAASPPSPATAAGARSLATLLGVNGPALQWGALAAFLLASALADLAFLLIEPLLRLQGPLPISIWVSSLVADLFLTAAAAVAFRFIRSDVAAAALAAVGYTLFLAVNQMLLMGLIFRVPFSPPLFLVFSCIGNFLFLFLLALAVRSLRPAWLGLWLGATAGQIAASLVYRFSGSLYGSLDTALVTDLVFAAVFAFAFWGGLALLAPTVLRES